MSTLTARYVSAVSRAVPESQRSDVEAEITAAIADLTEARLESGESPDAAELGVLMELGDPMRLAADYSNRPLHLIGPDHFPTYVRLLKVLAATVLPITTVAVIVAQLTSGADAGHIAAAAFSTLFELAMQLAFWLTVVFAVIERTPGSKTMHPRWNPSMLPHTPDTGVRLADTIAAVVMSLIGVAYLVWQNFRSPFNDANGTPIPSLSPDLWTSWIPVIIVGLLAGAVVEILHYRAGSWTWRFLVSKAIFSLMVTVPVVWLAATNSLLDPRMIDRLAELGWSDAALHLNGSIIVITIGVAVWELFESVRKTLGNTTTRAGQRPANRG